MRENKGMRLQKCDLHEMARVATETGVTVKYNEYLEVGSMIHKLKVCFYPSKSVRNMFRKVTDNA